MNLFVNEFVWTGIEKATTLRSYEGYNEKFYNCGSITFLYWNTSKFKAILYFSLFLRAYFDNQLIEQMNQFKDLGITIYGPFSFNSTYIPSALRPIVDWELSKRPLFLVIKNYFWPYTIITFDPSSSMAVLPSARTRRKTSILKREYKSASAIHSRTFKITTTEASWKSLTFSASLSEDFAACFFSCSRSSPIELASLQMTSFNPPTIAPIVATTRTIRRTSNE